MAKYRIAVTNVEYGFIEVEADSCSEAMDKAYSLYGNYYVHNSEVVNASYLEIMDE